jgi:hypothetical protein
MKKVKKIQLWGRLWCIGVLACCTYQLYGLQDRSQISTVNKNFLKNPIPYMVSCDYCFLPLSCIFRLKFKNIYKEHLSVNERLENKKILTNRTVPYLILIPEKTS